jgi:hypothetical protein
MIWPELAPSAAAQIVEEALQREAAAVALLQKTCATAKPKEEDLQTRLVSGASCRSTSVCTCATHVCVCVSQRQQLVMYGGYHPLDHP